MISETRVKRHVCTLSRASVDVSGLGLPIEEGLALKAQAPSTITRSHWEVLELSGSPSMGMLSQVSPSANLG